MPYHPNSVPHHSNSMPHSSNWDSVPHWSCSGPRCTSFPSKATLWSTIPIGCAPGGYLYTPHPLRYPIFGLITWYLLSNDVRFHVQFRYQSRDFTVQSACSSPDHVTSVANQLAPSQVQCWNTSAGNANILMELGWYVVWSPSPLMPFIPCSDSSVLGMRVRV